MAGDNNFDSEQWVFRLKDSILFSLGLSSVLECLVVAEQTGNVPCLSEEWWAKAEEMVRGDGAVEHIQEEARVPL